MSILVVGSNDTQIVLRSNDIQIVLRQGPRTGECGRPCPQWIYAAPTPLLEQKGLSAQVLQQELETIHSVCQKRHDEGPNTKRACYIIMAINVVLLIVWVVLNVNSIFTDRSGLTLTMVFSGALIFSCMASCCWWNRKLEQKYQAVLEALKQHLEVDLNHKYQSCGIRWTVQEKTVYVGKNTKVLNHIVVSCVDVPQQAQAQSVVQPQVVQVQGYQQQQQPAVLYVDQNGNPINVQQVRVVVVDQNNAANPPADTQPAEELPPYEGTTYT
mmetsp:Transcript_40981/g.65901  ORF Transcript_40981/g.65901 Transcript_40981/m.65901 type:complete len:270 (+) Transcript_40981:64-873(+)